MADLDFIIEEQIPVKEGCGINPLELEGRIFDSSAEPRRVVMGHLTKQGPLRNEYHIFIHEAGSPVIERCNVRRNQRAMFNLLREMNPLDAAMIGMIMGRERIDFVTP